MITVNDYYRQRFGCKVYKLSLDGGFTCPNRDGTLGTGGCRFCSGAGSGEFAAPDCRDISRQLEQAKEKVAGKCKDGKYLSYFQSFTNTYGPPERLEALYRAAIAPEEIVGLSVATRPDCLGPEVLDVLSRIQQETYVSVELGLQTIHDATARAMNRQYETRVYFEALEALGRRSIDTVTHLILGLPGETEEQMVESARAVGAAGSQGVKFHLLHVVRSAPLAEDYLQGKFRCLTLEEYGRILTNCIRVLPRQTVIHRITGDGPRRELLAPLWSLDKKRVLNYLNNLLRTSGQLEETGL